MVPEVRINRQPYVLFSLKDSSYPSLSNLNNKKVTVLIGGSKCPCGDEFNNVIRIPVSDHIVGLRMLVNRRVDLVSGPGIRLIETAKKIGVHSEFSKPLIYERRDVWLWSSKAEKSKGSFVEKFNHAINSEYFSELMQENLSSESMMLLKEFK